MSTVSSRGSFHFDDASYSLSRMPGKSADSLKVTIQLHKGDPEIYLLRMAKPDLYKKEIDRPVTVISSYQLAPGAQTAHKQEVWYAIPEQYKDNQELINLLTKVETPKEPIEKKGPIEEPLEIWVGNKPHIVLKVSYDAADPSQLRHQETMKSVITLQDSDDPLVVTYLVPKSCDPALELELLEQIKVLEDLPDAVPADPEQFYIISQDIKGTPTLINLSSKERLLGRGAFSEVYGYQSVRLSTDSTKESTNVIESLVAVKEVSDTKGAEALKRLWFDLEGMVGVEGVKQIRGIQRPYIRMTPKVVEEFLPGGTLQKVADTATDQEKARYALDLIQGLFWMQLVGSLHTDIKPENCLIGESGAVIIDHPPLNPVKKVDSPKEAKEVANRIEVRGVTPEFADMRLVIDVNRCQENIQTVQLQQLPESALVDVVNMTLDRVRQNQTFAMGATLFYLFTKKDPYPMRPFLKRKCPDFEAAGKEPSTKVWDTLIENGCPEGLASLIDEMLDITPDKRPTLFDFRPFILKHEPELTNLLDLAHEVGWKQQPSTMDNIWLTVSKATRWVFGE